MAQEYNLSSLILQPHPALRSPPPLAFTMAQKYHLWSLSKPFTSPFHPLVTTPIHLLYGPELPPVKPFITSPLHPLITIPFAYIAVYDPRGYKWLVEKIDGFEVGNSEIVLEIIRVILRRNTSSKSNNFHGDIFHPNEILRLLTNGRFRPEVNYSAK